jgi:hypothetical protein
MVHSDDERSLGSCKKQPDVSRMHRGSNHGPFSTIKSFFRSIFHKRIKDPDIWSSMSEDGKEVARWEKLRGRCKEARPADGYVACSWCDLSPHFLVLCGLNSCKDK